MFQTSWNQHLATGDWWPPTPLKMPLAIAVACGSAARSLVSMDVSHLRNRDRKYGTEPSHIQNVHEEFCVNQNKRYINNITIPFTVVDPFWRFLRFKAVAIWKRTILLLGIFGVFSTHVCVLIPYLRRNDPSGWQKIGICRKFVMCPFKLCNTESRTWFLKRIFLELMGPYSAAMSNLRDLMFILVSSYVKNK